MKAKLLLTLAGAAMASPAMASETGEPPVVAQMPRERIPTQLNQSQRDGYRTVFSAIREQRWTDAQLALESLQPGPLHAIARAELYTAKGSPKIELEPLVALLNDAPELPQAEALARLARARGAEVLPPLPSAQRLIWQDGAPRRVRAKAVQSDLVAAELATKMEPLVKDDLAADAQALLELTEGLSPEALTEWQARVAWMWFLRGNDAEARSLAAKAGNGVGEWAVQARWMDALAAWR